MAPASFEVTYKMTYESTPLTGSVREQVALWLRLAILGDRTSFARHGAPVLR